MGELVCYTKYLEVTYKLPLNGRRGTRALLDPSHDKTEDHVLQKDGAASDNSSRSGNGKEGGASEEGPFFCDPGPTHNTLYLENGFEGETPLTLLPTST